MVRKLNNVTEFNYVKRAYALFFVHNTTKFHIIPFFSYCVGKYNLL